MLYCSMHDVEACTPTGYVLNRRAPTPADTLVFFGW